jgi:hypothetical protein
MDLFPQRGKSYVDLSKGEGNNKILARLALRGVDFSRGAVKPMIYNGAGDVRGELKNLNLESMRENLSC